MSKPEYSHTSQILAARIQTILNARQGVESEDWVIKLASEETYPGEAWDLETKKQRLKKYPRQKENSNEAGAIILSGSFMLLCALGFLIAALASGLVVFVLAAGLFCLGGVGLLLAVAVDRY